MVAPLKNAVLAIQRRKQLGMLGQRLGGAEKQVTARPQRVMKHRHEPLLQLLVEIDQQIAARDQIDAREGRVADYAVRRKDAEVPHVLAQRVADAVAGKKTLEPLWADVLQHRRGVARRARYADRRIIDVGREHDDLRPRLELRHLFEQQHGDRVGLLAGCGSGYPDSDRIARPLIFEQMRNNALG